MESEKERESLKIEMIEEIKDELIFYFREGIINTTSFFDFDDIKFNNINDILKIHFLLTEEVKNYVLQLDKNIRKIKNSTKLEKNLYQGEVRGSIDWNKTVEYRANTLFRDRTRFICDNVDKLYNTKENIILKKAISIIYNIIHLELGMDRFKKRDWYKNGEEFSHITSNIYNGNVYIKRIDISSVKITSKMIQDVLKSRNELYRYSAQILKLYYEIMSMNKKHINNLFSKTFIELKSVDEVFEFYCIFKYIRNKFDRSNIKYNIIDGEEKYLASLEDDEYLYKIYHDRIGTKYLKFNLAIDEMRNTSNIHLNKKIASLDRRNEISLSLEKDSISTNYWSGRPDLLIIKLDKKLKLISLEIGEVKHTNNINYMYQGLEELLEYMYLVRDSNLNYIEFSNITGVLFTNNIKLNRFDFDNVEIFNRDRIKKM
ncbi:MAG: hypothetical protein GX752_00075 [Clostridium sp.]|nr:hypothetical protein [Clostridium sp.]